MFCSVSYGYISENTVGGCDVNVVGAVNNTADLRPVFLPHQHTCDAGYFLPANTDGCRPCPSGYTCNGGTFPFNETMAQGIIVKPTITQNTNNACATNLVFSDANFIANLKPIFVPNETITVNFTNGETTETITCTYDTEFALPEPPTRVGYVFTGWKVKNAE